MTTTDRRPDPSGRPRPRRASVFGRELVRYAAVSAVAFAVDTGLLLSLSAAGRPYLVAAAVGFLAGLAVTAVLSERFAFGGPRIASPVARQLASAAIGVVGLLLLWAGLWLLVDRAGMALLPAKLLVTGVVFGWNFLARRALFRPRTDTVPLR